MKRGLLIIFAFITCFWGLPTGLYAQGKSVNLRVITYNVHHCNPPAIKGLIDVHAIADVIKTNSADVAFLQEIDVRTTRVNGIDQSQELSQKSGLTYYHFFKAIDIMGGSYGVMILSRYPFDYFMTYPLFQEGESEQRVLGTAIVTLKKNIKVMLACTHLDLSARLRAVELNEIDSVLSKSSIPFILCGDFNATPTSSEMKLFQEKYKSSTNEFIPTFPNVNPDRTIDYIFIPKTSKMTILSHKVLSNIDASDHLPVIADICCYK